MHDTSVLVITKVFNLQLKIKVSEKPELAAYPSGHLEIKGCACIALWKMMKQTPHS